MILKIIFFISGTILVSANTGFPINPAQTYQFYQQNGYTNPTVNQPNDITPYLQGISAQNPMAPLDLSSSSIRQILLNKILSSPSMQTILDSNVKGYGSNFAESSNYPMSPNLGSNYYAVPSQNLNYKSTDTIKEEEAKATTTTEKPKKKRKSRRRHQNDGKHKNNSSKNDNTAQNVDITSEPNKKSKKRKQNTEATPQHHDTNNKENETNRTKTKRRKNKANNHTKQNPSQDENKVENPQPRKRRKKKPKSDKGNTENNISEHQTIPNIAPKDTKDSFNLAHLSEGITEESRIPRNPVYDGNELLKSLPENISNNFMKGIPQFVNNPLMSNYFANMYQSMIPNNMETNNKKLKKRRRPKRNRKQGKKRNRTKNRNSTETTVPVPTKSIILAVDTKADVATTERIIYINEKLKTNTDPISKDDSSKTLDVRAEMENSTDRHCETKERDLNPNINSNDPNEDNKQLDNGYIDDYYPLFTDNAAYNTDNTEVFIKNLGDTKYYYAMDKGNRRRFEAFGFPERMIKDYEKSKEYNDIEKEVLINEHKKDFEEKVIEETQFRRPPLLELPDFETRRVEKSEINPEPFYSFNDYVDYNHRFVGDKSSSNTEDKSSHYAGSKHNDIKSPNDKLPKDVETVFARSKVVKYGAVKSSEEDSYNAETTHQPLTDETNFQDGGTTYIFAKSFGDYPDTFW